MNEYSIHELFDESLSERERWLDFLDYIESKDENTQKGWKNFLEANTIFTFGTKVKLALSGILPLVVVALINNYGGVVAALLACVIVLPWYVLLGFGIFGLFFVQGAYTKAKELKLKASEGILDRDAIKGESTRK